MNYLVLGSSGQIGAALTQYLLDHGQRVIEFDIVHSADEDLRIPNNNKLQQAMDQADFVVFLAFDVGGSRYLKKYQNTYDFVSNNVKIMNNVFALLNTTKKSFIFISSQMSNMNFSPYGVLKALGECYTRSMGGIVAKFWNVYGIERDLNKSHVITDFILKAKQTRVISMLTDGAEERQFLFVNDACAALEILARSYSEIPRDRELHISSFKSSSIRQVAETVTSFMPGVKIVPGPDHDTVQHNQRNEPDPFILRYWKPKVSLEKGIEQMVRHYCSNSQAGA
ncbi:MAG: NAD(P)-dependent oxidoreductase [Kiritimatiellaeota bacterium]|nr:NAD(P)-dependent oxidoreductase [Kiritimatiellota bacterium]